MDLFSRQMLKELLPAHEAFEPPTPKQDRDPNSVDHWALAVLLERAAYLRRLAALSDGYVSETVKEYAEHSTMLLVRRRSGDAEVHEGFANLFFVLEGRATLVTGGTVHKARTTSAGEMRGESIEDGARQALRAGDVVHVAAGLAHQMLIEGENSITCLVVKIKQDH
jgi:quercetin dioxygenase-like cupin family protein